MFNIRVMACDGINIFLMFETTGYTNWLRLGRSVLAPRHGVEDVHVATAGAAVVFRVDVELAVALRWE